MKSVVATGSERFAGENRELGDMQGVKLVKAHVA